MGILWTFNLLLAKLFDLLLLPFAGLPPFWGLAFVSLITGAIMVLIFKYVSNQNAIRRAKNRIRGYFLEVWLYKHDFKTVMGTISRILTANLNYMRYALSPLLVMIIPVLLIMAQLNAYYYFQPLKPGQVSVLTVKWKNDQALSDTTLKAFVEKGVEIETPPVRAERINEVSWRIRAKMPGVYQLKMNWQGGEVSKKIAVSSGKVVRISANKSVNSSLYNAFFAPNEKPIKSNLGIQAINLDYPSRRIEILGLRAHWMVVFFILSLVAGFALKGLFKVEI